MRKAQKSLLSVFGFLAISASLTGCSSIGYLFQAGKGQLSLFTHARPIKDVIQDEKTPPRIKALLQEIEPIKKFGELNGLKPTTNYTEYVKLDRPAAIWVVSACEPLRFKSKEWSFPIVGDFPYLGWFDLDQAKKFASELKKENLDVDLRGASAYSTIGWFRDAVLSTMIPDGNEALGDLVNVVIHESVHATLYIKDQAYFNESIASFVAEKLTITYLDQKKGPESSEKKSYIEGEQRGVIVQKKLHETYDKLNELYQSQKTDSEKTQQKDIILSEIKNELHFRRDLNNATLIQYKTYHTDKEVFDQLFKACHFDMPKFMKKLATLEPKSFSKSQQNEFSSVIDPLIKEGC